MPVPVARKLLQDSNRLVAKAVATADEATAAAAAGVNLLFLQVKLDPAAGDIEHSHFSLQHHMRRQ